MIREFSDERALLCGQTRALMQRCAHRIAGIRHIGEFAHLHSHLQQPLIRHAAHSSLHSPMEASERSSIARMTAFSLSIM